jgi:hypothetical protein
MEKAADIQGPSGSAHRVRRGQPRFQGPSGSARVRRAQLRLLVQVSRFAAVRLDSPTELPGQTIGDNASGGCAWLIRPLDGG